MNAFIKTHKCNRICSKLGLPRPQMPADLASARGIWVPSDLKRPCVQAWKRLVCAMRKCKISARRGCGKGKSVATCYAEEASCCSIGASKPCLRIFLRISNAGGVHRAQPLRFLLQRVAGRKAILKLNELFFSSNERRGKRVSAVQRVDERGKTPPILQIWTMPSHSSVVCLLSRWHGHRSFEHRRRAVKKRQPKWPSTDRSQNSTSDPAASANIMRVGCTCWCKCATWHGSCRAISCYILFSCLLRLRP